jgi:hypothetical protein
MNIHPDLPACGKLSGIAKKGDATLFRRLGLAGSKLTAK